MGSGVQKLALIITRFCYPSGNRNPVNMDIKDIQENADSRVGLVLR